MTEKNRDNEKVLQINDLCLSFGKKKVLDHIDVQFDKARRC